jgi:UMF1 family MFS transporter
LWAGLVLLGATAACGDLASVPYNAMLRQLSTPETAGRISGLGWASGYLGSVLLLLLVYTGFISGSGSGPSAVRGLLRVPIADGLYVRVAMLAAAAWLTVLALPLLFVAHRLPESTELYQPTSMLGGYRKLWSELSAEWRRDRNLVYFLGASALFRDGLSAIFAFGAVLGVNVYGISQANVLIFGVVASVVAAVGAVLGGFVDHRVGSKPVIVGSLIAIITAALTLLVLSGSVAFWVCGLLLCMFIGPSQSSARALLLRMAANGREGMAFGLYTMTGRAVAFVAPWLFSVFVDGFGAVRAGLGGIALVLIAGLLAMLFVRVPPRHAPAALEES